MDPSWATKTHGQIEVVQGVQSAWQIEKPGLPVSPISKRLVYEPPVEEWICNLLFSYPTIGGRFFWMLEITSKEYNLTIWTSKA